MAAAQTDRLRAAASQIAGVEIYGPGEPADRLPHLVCLGIAGVEAEAVLIGLDQAGVAAHSGSACSSELLEPSPVLAAMGVNAERSLRLSVGWSTTRRRGGTGRPGPPAGDRAVARPGRRIAGPARAVAGGGAVAGRER